MNKYPIVQALALSGLLAAGAAMADSKPPSQQPGQMNKPYDTKRDDPRASMRPQTTTESTRTLTDAPSVYRAIVDKSGRRVPDSVRNAARCVAIFPRVVNAAVAIGGAHGNGVAFCRSGATDKDWGNPVFLNLTAASIGVQAGWRETDMVIFLTGDDARQRLEEGKLTFGGELSAVAGSYDQAVSIPNRGAVIYASSEGLFAGASFDGVNVSVDNDEEARFYGKGMRPFQGQIPSQHQSEVNNLRQLLPA